CSSAHQSSAPYSELDRAGIECNSVTCRTWRVLRDRRAEAGKVVLNTCVRAFRYRIDAGQRGRRSDCSTMITFPRSRFAASNCTLETAWMRVTTVCPSPPRYLSDTATLCSPVLVTAVDRDGGGRPV